MQGVSRIAFAAVVFVLIAMLGALPAQASFTTGFADGIYETAPGGGGVWLDRTVATGAQFILLPVDWATISPQRPPAGTDPSSPSNPTYNWGTLDATVNAAAARGLTVAFTVAGGGGGPAWADGPGRPANAAAGTWRPSASALKSFATALARRYSGSFNAGAGLLAGVRYYQAWSEPNLNNHLTPQWVRSHGHWVAESPIIYRSLLNAFYAGVKSVHSSNVVITGGTAPFGDAPGGARIRPAEFVRDMLCISAKLRPQRCPNPAHFDILAHHPYAIGGPFAHALVADDVSVPDIGKLTRPLRVAERRGRALPHGHKRIWVTEFSWDSNPPDPQAVPMSRLSQWLEESFYVLWHQGVSAIAWFLIADQAPVPNYASTYQSGMYFLDGSPKPAIQAFRFPFVVERAGKGRGRVWGIAPQAGTVLVQRLGSHGWETALSFHTRAHGVFTRVIGLRGKPLMRAEIGAQTSLSWRAP